MISSALARAGKLGGIAAPIAVLFCLVLLIGIMRPSTFALDQVTIKTAAAMTLILVATGQTIVIMRGGIDLSVSGVLSIATAIAATRQDLGLASSLGWMAAIAGLGAAIGMLNGVIITTLRLQPFLVTLATWSMIQGTALITLPAEAAGVPMPWVTWSYGTFGGIPVPILFLVLLVLWWAWFRRTRLMNTIRAAGSNERSAFLNRVSILGTNVAAYGLSGLFAALAGLFFAMQTGSGSPTVGNQYVLPAIAAVVIGGTSLAGGRGGLAGTIIGAFILTLIGDVVFLLKLSSYWQPVVSGLILMGAVVLSSLSEIRSSNAEAGQ